VFARYHDQATAPAVTPEDGETTDAAEPAEASPMTTDAVVVEGSPVREATTNATGEGTVAGTEEETNPLGLAPVDTELYQDVPSLVTAAQIREAMDQLAEELKAANDIYLLIDGAQGYRLVTHPRFAKWIRVQRDEPPPVKLTQSALETLSVVAYRQPVTRSEIEAIRGVSSENVLGKLMERDLIYVVGRADLPGRPIQYGTTDRFLEFVGVKSLMELPASDVLSPRQIDEWLNRSANVTPPADAEMGLPLEEGEGESPSLEPVEIAHVDAPAHADPEAEVEESIEGDTPVPSNESASEPSSTPAAAPDPEHTTQPSAAASDAPETGADDETRPSV
jgi:segregation and condensation protein B